MFLESKRNGAAARSRNAVTAMGCSMSVTKWSIVLPVVLLAVAACHSRPPVIATTRPPAATAAPAPASPVHSAGPAATSAATPLNESELFDRMTLDDLNASHPLNDVFFDYDANTLRDDARQVLQRNAQWLAQWPQTRIRIDGHCDERGTEEYNLALGDQRAVTVRDYLASLGVNPDRIQTVSLGRESPFCTATGESCWGQNRRGHFVITTK
jgi:peptidoglycan-associated lipoprotein